MFMALSSVPYMLAPEQDGAVMQYVPIVSVCLEYS
jgi:hypothetical protein